MRQEKDIYWMKIAWDRYDTWSKIGYLKATLNYALKNEETKEELTQFIKEISTKL